MSKERLEGFREFIDFMYESIDIEDHQRFIAISETMIKDGWFKWIYKYAKEQAERVQELEEDYEYLSHHYDLETEQNKRYREAIEYIKIELRDFRKDANTIKKLSRDRIVQGEAFRLSCDIRDCLKALKGESE